MNEQQNSVRDITDEEWNAYHKEYGLIALSITEYEELLRAQQKLNALESAGVDNWEGYYFAMEELKNG